MGIVSAVIGWKGIVPEKHHKRYIKLYCDVKSGVVNMSMTGLIAMALKEFGSDLAIDGIKKNAYPILVAVLPSGFCVLCGGIVYSVSEFGKIRSVAAAVVNFGVGLADINAHVANTPFLIVDLILFGRPVIGNTPGKLFNKLFNETSAINKLLD